LFVIDVIGLLIALHYDYIIDAAENLITVVRLKQTNERYVTYP